MEWSFLALDRISEIARYIAKDNPDAAVRWVNELFESVERLADFPESGRVVPEFGVRRIRELIFGAYRMIYSVKDKVEILTVRRGSQLLQLSEFDDEPAQQDSLQRRNLAEVMTDISSEGRRMDCPPALGIPRQRSDSASDECIRS